MLVQQGFMMGSSSVFKGFKFQSWPGTFQGVLYFSHTKV